MLASKGSETMDDVTDNCLDSQLWHASAGGMVHMPPVNSKVYYFPQGHAEHTHGNVDFGNSRIPVLVLCRVAAVKFMADHDTDEVYAKIRLLPLKSNELDYCDDNHNNNYNDCDDLLENNVPEPPDKHASFAKTLTQSDANNGGGFSVPRYCAETIFPRLDYSADPPVQTVLAKDVHGEIWNFRHIYRGTPRRHLLTTGWSTFVNHKKLIAGDSIVFLRTENGDLCVGIRRAKRGLGGGPDALSGWNPTVANCVSPYSGFSAFLREDETKLMRNGSGGNSNFCGSLKGRGKVRPELVVEAATLAANAQPFEVVYYPRASTPEFCVKASSVRASMRIKWSPGMKFKMAFETEDSSRISWFMGTISNAQVADPVRWPNSPWRYLQVTWDEPDLLQNVKRVSPWLVELVSNMPTIHMSPFSPPRKKLRLLQHPDFPLDGQLPIPFLSSNTLGSSSPLCCLSDNTPAGIQGARHAQFGVSISDHLNKLQSGLFPTSFQRLDHITPPSMISSGVMMDSTNNVESVSCLLTIGNSNQSSKKSNKGKTPQLVLFGQPILTEQQISLRFSADTVSPVINGMDSSDGNPDKTESVSDGSEYVSLERSGHRSSPYQVFPWYMDHRMNKFDLETSHCKVFMDSEDVGRTLDLSLLGSYEELYRVLANMFGIERSEMLSHVLYQDATGAIKRTEDEPFSEFIRTAKRLTVLTDSGKENVGRTRVTGLQDAENGLTSSNKRGLLSMFA